MLKVVVGWNFNGVMVLRRHVCHQEVRERFQHVSLLQRVPNEQAVSVYRVVDHVVGRKATELDDLEHLVVVILPWENRQLDKQLNGCAA